MAYATLTSPAVAIRRSHRAIAEWIAFGLVWISSSTIHADIDHLQVPVTYDNVGGSVNEFGQTFVALDPAVVGIQLFIGDPVRPTDPNVNSLTGTSVVCLYSATTFASPILIASAQVQQSQAAPGSARTFLFSSPVSVQVGSRYFFIVRAPDLYGVGLRSVSTSTYADGAEMRLSSGGSLTEGSSGRDLSFRVLSTHIADTYGQTVFRRPDSPASERPPGKDSLIIVTHGWQPDAPNTDWVNAMASSIDSALSSQGIDNWYVEPLLWPEDAHTTFPEKAAQNGEEIGALRGREIAAEGWSHVHFIAHSAGSALIHAATLQIKARTSSTTVHATFLDPFVGLTTIGRHSYGENSDWADNYFADDVTTWPTRGRLTHAHNVNVTPLDPLATPLLLFSSTANSTPAVETHPDSTHGWPYQFYANTIPPHSQSGSQGYGFPLSKEGGGWASRASFPPNNVPVSLGASGIIPDIQLRIHNGAPVNFVASPIETSGGGVVITSGGVFTLSSTPPSAPQSMLMSTPVDAAVTDATDTGSNAWLSCTVAITDAVNFVAFDAQFTSPIGAEGLLTVYWNTNVIGTVDERTALPDMQPFRFPLPQAVSSGVYALGFRLDSFTNISSSITITNVATGLAGSVEPITLRVTNGTSGVVLTVAAPSNYNYIAHASSNLTDWSAFAILVNTNGTVPFFDPAMSNHQQRFYRVTRP